jgi:hypothetical protein
MKNYADYQWGSFENGGNFLVVETLVVPQHKHLARCLSQSRDCRSN